MKRLVAIAAALLLVTVSIVGCGGSGRSYPTCTPHSHECRETSDAAWVPIWYFLALQNAQNSASVTANSGVTPSTSEEESAGAPPAAVEDQSGSADEAGSDDSGDESGDDSGEDDSGGDDGG